MLNNILFATIIICLVMLPMAVEDYKHRNIGKWLFYVFIGVAIGLFIFGEVWSSTSMLFIIAFGIVWIASFSYMNFMKAADSWISIFSILALGFVGVLAFFLCMAVVAIISIIKRRSMIESIRGLPFITIYLCSLGVVFFGYIGVVALRI